MQSRTGVRRCVFFDILENLEGLDMEIGSPSLFAAAVLSAIGKVRLLRGDLRGKGDSSMRDKISRADADAAEGRQ